MDKQTELTYHPPTSRTVLKRTSELLYNRVRLINTYLCVCAYELKDRTTLLHNTSSVNVSSFGQGIGKRTLRKGGDWDFQACKPDLCNATPVFCRSAKSVTF